VGAIVGAVVGAAVLGVLIWLFIWWRKKSKTKVMPYETGKVYENDEKQVTYASHMPLDAQPELHGEAAEPYVAELESSPTQRQPGAGYYAADVPTRSVGEMDGNAPVYSAAPVPLKYQHTAPAPQEIHELAPKTPTTTRRELSREEVASLEDEERRIDAELEEVRKMKELRDQKLAIQQKLREARK
jgi:hypothetical protein